MTNMLFPMLVAFIAILQNCRSNESSLFRDDTRGFSTRETRYPCVFDSLRLSKHPRRRGRHALALARACVRSRGGRSGDGLPKSASEEGGSFRVFFKLAEIRSPRASTTHSRWRTRVATLTMVTSFVASRNLGWFSSEPRMSDRRVRVARLARDDWTPPKGERQRRRRGEEQGEGEGTRYSLPLAPLSPTEKDRGLRGSPTQSTIHRLPHPVESSDASHSPRLRSFHRLPPPTMHVAASFPSAPDVVAVPPHGRDDDDGGKETEFCHRRATPSSSSSASWPLSHAFVHRLANRTHLSACYRWDASTRASRWVVPWG